MNDKTTKKVDLAEKSLYSMEFIIIINSKN